MPATGACCAAFFTHPRGAIEIRQAPGLAAALDLHQAVTRCRIRRRYTSVHHEANRSAFIDEFDLRSRRQANAEGWLPPHTAGRGKRPSTRNRLDGNATL